MMTVLAAVRDFLVALALAWVGVTLEVRTSPEPAACEDQSGLCTPQNGE
jgi:hypothetical protein